MPRTRIPLPEPLASGAFTVRSAQALGVSLDRLKAPTLRAPFHTVRMDDGPLDPVRLAAAFALRQGPDQAISHTTALVLWGAPLPARVEQQEAIHVSSIGPSRPRTRSTIPHQLDPDRTTITRLGELSLTDPATSWVLSAPLLGLDDLVAAGDFLVTGTHPFDAVPPLSTHAELSAATDAMAGARGIRRAREALGLVRYGPLSRRETQLRLMFWRGGLPEPELNFRVHAPGGRFIHMLDLAHPAFRVGTEYESLLHQSPEKFRRDIRKQQELAAIGWSTHRLTSDEVDPRLRTPASRAALARIAADLRSRGWSG
ncbi:hypothetical protein [Protaetiibacter larvae]|uniref:DUF559 domain-containing protein n=1 Tax=Protaetiibacter larvae TaxID=2592654 RepID=A0A5C1Y847_9MICO|nr:hypothetical protein [Protaetiibacter larvae]QEO09112.1 hypothetical protein FLP23_03225 [Protaetiibacter larvae]